MWARGHNGIKDRAVKFENEKCKLEFHVSQCDVPLSFSPALPRTVGPQMNSKFADRLERAVKARILDIGHCGTMRGARDEGGIQNTGLN